MKSKYLDTIVPLRDYYDEAGTILKSETYLVHMVYIIYHYSELGKITSITINGVEYPPNIELEFDVKTQKLNIRA